MNADIVASTIGGSEAFELLEIPHYGRGCRRALAYRKLGIPSDYPVDRDDAILQRGNRIEPIAAAIYEEVTGRTTRRTAPNRLHREFPWARVSTDRLIRGGGDGIGDLELKSRGEGPFRRLQAKGAFLADILQTQWSLWVTGHKWGALAELGVFGGLPMLHFDVEPDPKLHEVFEREGAEFSRTVWQRGELPEPSFPPTDQRCRVCAWRMQCRGEALDTSEAATLREISNSKRELVQIDNPALTQTLTELDLMKQEAKALEESIGLAKDKALQELGAVDAALLKGYGKVYRLPTKANYFDSSRLKADNPTLWERYMIHRATGDYYLKTYPAREL